MTVIKQYNAGTAAWETIVVGKQGPVGATGQGVPTGGTSPQVLRKKSATNYDTEWASDWEDDQTVLASRVFG